MRIVSLLENTAGRADVGAEHGLSLYIEACGRRILFDMGQTDLYVRNAERLGVRLEDVEIAILSHGHYDHGGGLAAFHSINMRASVYCDRRAFFPRFNAARKDIGLNIAFATSPRLIEAKKRTVIAPGLTILPSSIVPDPTDHGGLMSVECGKLVPDRFPDEQYLLIEEGGLRVLISGCSHRGVLAIAEAVRPDVMIGGFHLSKHPCDGALRQKAEALAALPTRYYTCHCTGEAQFAYMKQFMPNLSYRACGDILTL